MLVWQDSDTTPWLSKHFMWLIDSEDENANEGVCYALVARDPTLHGDDLVHWETCGPNCEKIDHGTVASFEEGKRAAEVALGLPPCGRDFQP